MGKIYNRLVAGIEAGATDGFDNLWDAPALTASPDPEKKPVLRAYFSGPLWEGYTWSGKRATNGI